MGPYEVLKHVKNDVECRHLALKNIKVFYVGDLKPFTRSLESAKELAMVDADQFLGRAYCCSPGKFLQAHEYGVISSVLKLQEPHLGCFQ